MKISKILMAMAAIAMMALTACGNKNNPVQQVLELIESTTPKVEQAKDMDELTTIQENFQKQFESIESPGDYKPTAEEESRLQTAMTNYLQAYIMKVNELAETSIPVTSGEVDQNAAADTISEDTTETSE